MEKKLFALDEIIAVGIPFHESPHAARLQLQKDKRTGRKTVSEIPITRWMEWRVLWFAIGFVGLAILALTIEFLR